MHNFIPLVGSGIYVPDFYVYYHVINYVLIYLLDATLAKTGIYIVSIESGFKHNFCTSQGK